MYAACCESTAAWRPALTPSPPRWWRSSDTRSLRSVFRSPRCSCCFFRCSVSNCPSCRRFQEIRRRHRYLAHLPLTCEFSICELSLQPPIISKETLDTFAGLFLFFKGCDVTDYHVILNISLQSSRRLGEEEASEAEEGERREAPREED